MLLRQIDRWRGECQTQPKGLLIDFYHQVSQRENPTPLSPSVLACKCVFTHACTCAHTPLPPPHTWKEWSLPEEYLQSLLTFHRLLTSQVEWRGTTIKPQTHTHTEETFVLLVTKSSSSRFTSAWVFRWGKPVLVDAPSQGSLETYWNFQGKWV